jgi:hypothetical protein
MLYNRREHWAEGAGLSADKFGPSDLHFGTHGGLPTIDLTGGHLFGDFQDTWSPAFVDSWTPTSSEFSVSPTFSNHWDLTLTGTQSQILFSFKFVLVCRGKGETLSIE